MGGLTYAEVSALRFLSQQDDCELPALSVYLTYSYILFLFNHSFIRFIFNLFVFFFRFFVRSFFSFFVHYSVRFNLLSSAIKIFRLDRAICMKLFLELSKILSKMYLFHFKTLYRIIKFCLHRINTLLFMLLSSNNLNKFRNCSMLFRELHTEIN